MDEIAKRIDARFAPGGGTVVQYFDDAANNEIHLDTAKLRTLNVSLGDVAAFLEAEGLVRGGLHGRRGTSGAEPPEAAGSLIACRSRHPSSGRSSAITRGRMRRPRRRALAADTEAESSIVRASSR